MAAPKMKIIAKRFLSQIKDVYAEDPVTGLILETELTLVRSINDLNNYIGKAMNEYFRGLWNSSAGRQNFLKALPELFGRTSLAIPFGVGVSLIDLSTSPYKDIFDILDSSYTQGGIVEAWDNIHLNDALAGTDPFYTASATNPAIIYASPILYLFPINLTLTTAFSFILNYIKLPISPSTGNFLDVNGNEDCPFSINHLQAIADIATKLYDIDDNKEDVA